MKTIEQRFLRGPNFYASVPCVMAVLEAEEAEMRVPAIQIYHQLVAALPGVIKQPAAALVPKRVGACALGLLVELALRELQTLAGLPPALSRSRPVRGPGCSSRVRVVCAYQLEYVAGEALTLATSLISALARQEPYELAAPLAALLDGARRRATGTSTAAVVTAARQRGIPTARLSEESNLYQLGWGSRQKRLQATITGDAGTLAVRIASDKQLTKTLLAEAGIPTPKGATAMTLAQAQSIALSIGRTVTIKPLDANQGKGVTTICRTPEEVALAYEHARHYSKQVIVERYLQGQDYRVLVTGDKVAAASLRRPPAVTGDGHSTVRELVEQENRNPARGEGHSNILTRIALDEVALATLAGQDATPESVPAMGVTLRLRGNANLSTGGTAEDVTDLLHEETRALCVRAARKIGLDVAGIDIVCDDIALPLREQGGGVIEVNAAPGIRMHQYPSSGQPRDAGGAIIDAMFPQGDARIPVLAVTGTNGKTTTALMLGHAARLAGLRSGVTTTEGIFINGQRVFKGDCSGYWSARTILTAPEVDFAVLETARGGILKRGLAFDRCDVAVVLNVSADHLGQDGIDSVRALARVKEVVARNAARALVLNAEDVHCVAMGRRHAGAVEILYFSLDPDHPVLLRHLERGGRGAYLQDGMLVLADGTRRHALLRADTMPSALNGHARYNIANALASAAALRASGFEPTLIAQALGSFVSDNHTNPLRSNLFRLRNNVTLIVDYAHNPAAYDALGLMARSMAAGAKVVGVITAPGDRREGDLRATGHACAQHFDELFVYESSRRGRDAGATGALITSGISGPEIRCRHWQQIDSMRAALDAGLARCVPGDVMVFSCASSLTELVNALRMVDPVAAQRIAAEVRLDVDAAA